MSTQPPLVSIVITTYNREDYLESAIESVLKQTYPNFELLIWDDGSTDRTLEVARNAVREFAHIDQRVEIVAAPHQGRVAALRAAIAQTHGSYLGWVDSDDWLAPNALEQTTAVLDANLTVGMVYTDYVEIDSKDTILRYGQRCNIPYSQDRLLLDFMTFHFRLIRRSVFDQVGGLEDCLDLIEDYDLCLRLSEIAEIQPLRKPLYHYRIHSDSICQQWKFKQVLQTHIAMKRALERRGLATHYEIQANLLESRFYLRRKRPAMQRRVAAVLPFLAALPLVSTLSGGMAQAQIVPTPNDAGTIVTPNGNRFNITGGTLSRDQLNLFHSFSQFGLSREQIGNFLANPALANILVRVNGGNASVIDGLLRVSGGNANLFFMNPSGIIFGANARLDVSGSFTATTANGIGFRSGWFNALGTNDYAALVGLPNTFAFTAQPGSIVNAGSLAVGNGQRLTLLGGTVVNTGTLDAPGGQVTIAAIPGDRVVRLSQPGDVLNLEIQTATGGSVPNAWTFPVATLPQLLTGAGVGVQTGLTANADGTVQVAGAGTVIPTDAGTAIASGAVNVSGTQGGEVNVLGSKVGLVSASINASGTSGGGLVRIGGDYQGKGTVPNALRTFVSRDSVIRADGLVSGDGGRVFVWANEATGFYGNISARTASTTGNGGFVEVSGKQSLMFDGGVDLGAGNGKLGTLLLDPENITISNAPTTGGVDGLLLGANTYPTVFSQTILPQDAFGDASININARVLEAVIGNVTLEAKNNITIAQGVSLNFVQGGIVFTPFSGFTPTFVKGGSITFTADADNNGVGSFVMDQTQTIATAGRDLTIRGASITAGAINAAGTAGTVGVSGEPGKPEVPPTVRTVISPMFGIVSVVDKPGIPATPGTPGGNGTNGGNSGSVTLTATSGGIRTGTISTAGGDGGSGGNGGDGGGNNGGGGNGDGGNGGNGGNSNQVILTSTSGEIVTGAITASGGKGGNGGTRGAGFVVRNGANGVSGSSPGSVTLRTGGAITTGNIDARVADDNSDNAKGNIITLTALGGDLKTGNINVSAVVNPPFNVLGLDAVGGTVILNSSGTITTGTLTTSARNSSSILRPGAPKVAAKAGSVSLTAGGGITTNNINSSAEVNSTSKTPPDSSPTIIIHDAEGGNVTLTANRGDIQTSAIVTSASDPIGARSGNVSLTSSDGSITASSIDTAAIITNPTLGSGEARGGRVDITAPSSSGLVRITDRVSDQSPYSILTRGVAGRFIVVRGGTFTILTNVPIAQGGAITITHGGGLRDIPLPFTVGDSTRNGAGESVRGLSFGTLYTGSSELRPKQSILAPDYSIGNIRIITSFLNPQPPQITRQRVPVAPAKQAPLEKTPEGIQPTPFSPPSPLPCASSVAAAVEGKFAQQYEKSLGSRLTRKTVLDACEVLRSIQASTGVRPGIIYAVFVPPEVDPKNLKLSTERSPNDYLALILITPRGGEVISVREAKRAKVEVTARDFQTKVTAPRQGDAYKTPGEELYNWLITPLLPELKKQGTENLTFILDESLRGIPLAALYSSKAEHLGHLIEQGFSVGMMPSLNLTDTRYASIRNVSMLAVGRSDFRGIGGLDNLPTVPTEINLLTQRVWNRSGNEQLLDPKDNINPDSLAAASRKEFGIIHLSTHAQFKAEDPTSPQPPPQVSPDQKNEPAPPPLHNSFIQLSGTNVLRLDQFRTLGLDKPPRELLVLSACQTALGDLQAELGFAGLATQAGVKSALGSLWRVDEGGSLALMTEFYQQLPAARIKAEALQQAQLNMIGKKVHIQKRNPTGTELIWTKGAEPLPVNPENPNPQIPDFTHPYYWSGFTLVGNPW